ncbi:MAG: hypothetical protein EOO78_36975 [Oxalobacteraceae bacterium]|nr:MAG: hypothetical protein EOO78_36975 [Oxalobacteraceae bacterium]
MQFIAFDLPTFEAGNDLAGSREHGDVFRNGGGSGLVSNSPSAHQLPQELLPQQILTTPQVSGEAPFSWGTNKHSNVL